MTVTFLLDHVTCEGIFRKAGSVNRQKYLRVRLVLHNYKFYFYVTFNFDISLFCFLFVLFLIVWTPLKKSIPADVVSLEYNVFTIHVLDL